MLESIRLKNFQKHRAIEIEFDPLVTCITGQSGAGKSSILRAIRWICINRPSGDSFIRHGKKGTVGELTVDGVKVIRKKGSGKNEYLLAGRLQPERVVSVSNQEGNVRLSEGNGKIGSESTCIENRQGRKDTDSSFKAFGTEPPQAVQKVLNVSEENFARQLDAPYFFSLTPGQAAKALNEVIDLEVIDRTLGKLAAGQRKAKAELEVGRQRYLDAEAKGKELVYIRQMDADLRGAEKAEEVYERTKERADALRGTIGGAEKVRREREVAAQASLEALGACRLGEVWQEKAVKAADLRESLYRLERLGKERCEIEEKLKGLVERTSRFSHCPLCGQATK